MLAEPKTDKFQKRDWGQSQIFYFIFIKSIKKCKRRAFSYFNNVFAKEGLVSEGKLSLTEPKTEKCQKCDKRTTN